MAAPAATKATTGLTKAVMRVCCKRSNRAFSTAAW